MQQERLKMPLLWTVSTAWSSPFYGRAGANRLQSSSCWNKVIWYLSVTAVSFWYEEHRADQMTSPSSPIFCFLWCPLVDAQGGPQGQGKDGMFASTVSQSSEVLAWFKPGCVGTMQMWTIHCETFLKLSALWVTRRDQNGRGGQLRREVWSA